MEPLSRRNFLKTAGLGTAGAILGIHGLSAKDLRESSAPGKGAKVRLAAVGIANRGAQIIEEFERTGLCEFVALCDVDLQSKESRQTIAKYPKAKVFKDFRKLFDEYADHFDAVCIAIPDFAHFPVSILALHCGNVPHQFEQVLPLHLKHNKIVLERRNEDDVTLSDNPFRHIVAKAANIDESHIGSRQTSCRSPFDHHICSPIAKQTFWSFHIHRDSAQPKSRRHHAVHTCLVRSNNRSSLGRRIFVQFRRNLYTFPTEGTHLIILCLQTAKTCCKHQKSQFSSHIPMLFPCKDKDF